MQTALRLLDKEAMDKQRALDAALGQIERAFGKGSIMKLGSREAAADTEVISTGSLGLDIALGIGGLPRGRIIEIYGPESSGKTTLALHVIAEAQRGGGTCAFIDAEHALDPAYARKLGVNIDDLLISQPDAGEQALEIADTLVRSGAIDVLVIDSDEAAVRTLLPALEEAGHTLRVTHTGAGGLVGTFLVAKKLILHIDIISEHGPLLLLATVLFLSGIQFISMGLLGEISSRTYYESQNKPIYALREVKSHRKELGDSAEPARPSGSSER